MNKKIIIPFLGCLIGISSAVWAEEIEKNTAKMQAMDKITGRVSVINVPVGGEVKFGSFSIVVRSCQTRPVEEAPDNFAFVDVSDTNIQGEQVNIFKGWMISSSPATHAVEHPIYDVWLLQCIDHKIDKSLLLNEEQLAARDSLPMQRGGKITDTNAETENDIVRNTLIEEMQAPVEPNAATTIMDMNAVEFLYDEDAEDTTDVKDNQTDNQDDASASTDITAEDATHDITE